LQVALVNIHPQDILMSKTDIALAVDYGASLIVAKEGSTTEQGDGTDVSSSRANSAVSQEKYASKIKLGMRMPSFKVLNQSDARPWHFQELLKSNGRWRVAIFTGNILTSSQKKKIWALGDKLAAQDSFIRKYTPAGKSISSVIEVLAVHSAPRTEADLFSFPPIFRPFSETSGFDYSKLFVDDESYHEGHGHAYEEYGVDPQVGCAVILRPDQYVGWIGAVDDYEMMARYFAGFMRERGDGGMREGIDAGGVLERVGGGGPAADLAERDRSVLGAM
jgi:phenol 2-monooxygenase